MKKVLSLLFFLSLICAFSFAQEFGAIRGTVSDPDGNPLPGVAVTLTGSKIAPMTEVTSDKGNFRFLSLPGASDYTIKFEMKGFKTVIREKQVVSFGRDIVYDIKMEMAAIEESVTVIGATPVIDTKKTQVGVNISETMIMSLPTSRNPWTLMALAPGMMIDREDVGGSDSGQQSAYYGHGAADTDSTWNIDGANITDNSALGAAPAYLNMAGYEEFQVNYGNNDIKSQTGGVQINFITKRGGNAFSGTFFLDAEDKAWQSSNLSPELTEIGYKGAGVNKVYLYGANFGGPIVRDKAWFYGSYGIQDIDSLTLAGTSDKTWLQSAYLRLDVQPLSGTRINLFYEYDNKLKWGRTNWGATKQGPETVWNQTGPTPIYKVEAEQTWGNLYLNAKYIYSHNTFHLEPTLGARTADGSGPYMFREYSPSFYCSGNIADYGTVRPMTNVNFNGNYFAEDVIGANHELKFGVDYTKSSVSSFSLYEANLQIAHRKDGTYEAWLLQDWLINKAFNRLAFFVQDTATWGKFTAALGLRYDIEASTVSNENVPTCPWLPQYLAAINITKLDPGIKSKIFSPRLSLIYDLRGNGKDVIKLNIARYGSQSGYEFSSFLNPVGNYNAEIDLRWVDGNGDKRVQANELFGVDPDTGALMDPNDPAGWLWFGYFDPTHPGNTVSSNKYDPSYKSPLLDEVSLSYEKEILADFAVRVEGFYKKRYRFQFDRGIMEDGSIETEANYFLEGTDEVTHEPYFGRYEWPIATYRGNTKKANERYLAAEIVLKKRLSHRWMLDSSFTYMDWRYYCHNEHLDFTNHVYYNGGVEAPESGGSGITDVFVNSPWMFKFTGLYQFPYGINGGINFIARAGYVVPPYNEAYEPRIGWVNLRANSTTSIGKFGDKRLPTFTEMNLRVEKVFKIGETMAVTVSGDCFNVFNSATPLSVEANLTSPDYWQTLRILNPRLFRFGIRFNF